MSPVKTRSICVSVVLLAACGGDAANTTTSTHSDAQHHGTEFTYGEPGDPAAAGRVIAVVTTDTLRFEPDDLTIARGETITFRVTNDGFAVHDFTLGDEAAQREHAAMMATLGADAAHMADEPNSILIPAGETKEITWTFTVAGEVQIGCHQPGHYEAGMRATITVTG